MGREEAGPARPSGAHWHWEVTPGRPRPGGHRCPRDTSQQAGGKVTARRFSRNAAGRLGRGATPSKIRERGWEPLHGPSGRGTQVPAAASPPGSKMWELNG